MTAKGKARALTIGLGLVVAALALTAGMTLRAAFTERSGGSTLATTLDFGAPFELMDHFGNPITEAAFEGQPSLLFFGFTNCPDICPSTIYDIDSWFETMGEEGADVGAYFVTVDPERDTAPFLKDYITYQTDRVVGITGEPDAVRDLARAWRVYFRKVPLGEGDYTMDHFASVYVLDRDGELFDKISYGEASESAIAKIRAALGS